MDNTTQFLTIVIFFLALVVTIIVTQFVRRRRSLYTLREIAAFQRLPGMIGEAIESNRPVHVSLGNAGLGGESTLVSLANAELFYQVARRAVIGTAAPIFTVGDTSALPLAQDTLRRAYASRGRVSSAPYTSARWYPGGGGHSLAFAAALTATVVDDKVGANILGGSFGTELALVGYAAARRNQSILATSDQLEGQAVAWVMSDESLIGEEVFTAGAYLGEASSQVAGVVTQDVLRWLLIFGILLPTIIALGNTFSNGSFGESVQRAINFFQQLFRGG
ncbi:MAG: hypothetical protein GC179_27680 [Anaerolineaceae bacterium]|nr:hypothetical protein [Anaerolineaceae bacterium]